MFFDVGLSPILQLTLTGALVAVSSNILLDYFSYWFSLSTRRWQNFVFDHLGRNSLIDFIMFVLLQAVSFRKKSFFDQLGALINVRTFSTKQNGVILIASFIGLGLSILLIAFHTAYLPLLLLLGFWGRKKSSFKEMKPFFMALLSFFLFGLLLIIFDSYLKQSSLNIHTYKIGPALILLISYFASKYFRTPAAFLVSFSFLYVFMDINAFWFPVFFLIYNLVTLSGFYITFLGKHSRTYHSLFLSFFFQTFQFLISLVFAIYFFDNLKVHIIPQGFLSSFKIVIGLFAAYQIIPLLILLPLVLLMRSFLSFSFLTRDRGDTQKILYFEQKSSSFSIHLSIYLLKQEFKKYLSTMITLFDWAHQIVEHGSIKKERFEYYHGVLTRVGEEVKELCVKITEHKCPKELNDYIMSHYKAMGQLDQMVQALYHLLRGWMELQSRKDLSAKDNHDFSELLKSQVAVLEIYFQKQIDLPLKVNKSVIENLMDNQAQFNRFCVTSQEDDLMRESQLISNTIIKLI